MNYLENAVQNILEKSEPDLTRKSFESKRQYMNRFLRHAEMNGYEYPCQELYDSFLESSCCKTNDITFLSVVIAVDAECGTRAVRSDGWPFNEPPLPSFSQISDKFCDILFPVEDDAVDITILIMMCYQMALNMFSTSTANQYFRVWRKLRCQHYLNNNMTFCRAIAEAFLFGEHKLYETNEITWADYVHRRHCLYVFLDFVEDGLLNWKIYSDRACWKDSINHSLDNVRCAMVRDLRTRNLSDGYISASEKTFHRFMEEACIADESDLKKLSPTVIQSYVANTVEGFSDSSKATIVSMIRNILSFLYDFGYTDVNLSFCIPEYHRKRKHTRPYIPPDESNRLFLEVKNLTSNRKKAIMYLAMELGVRAVDIINLQLSSIDWKNEEIIFIQKKTGEQLSLPLTKNIGNALARYLLEERPQNTDSPYVFLRQDAPYQKMTDIYHIASHIMISADIKTENRQVYGTHVCRFTLVNKMLSHKIPHQIITDVLGHSSKDSDKPYMAIDEKMLRECPLDLSVVGQKHWEEEANL